MFSVLVGMVLGSVIVTAAWWARARLHRPPAPRVDPWKQDGRYSQCVELPVDTLRLIAKRDRLMDLRRNQQPRLERLEHDIDLNGLREPLIVIVDEAGRVALKDGHSRLTVCPGLGYTKLPVRYRKSNRLRSHGRSARDVLVSLIDRAPTQTETTALGVSRGRGGSQEDAPASGAGGSDPVPVRARPSALEQKGGKQPPAPAPPVQSRPAPPSPPRPVP